MTACCSLVTSARRSRLRFTSESRKSRAEIPRSSSSFRSALASARVKSFSRSLPPNTAPLSSPPWLGSIITKNSGRVRPWVSPSGTGWETGAEAAWSGAAVKRFCGMARAISRAPQSKAAAPSTNSVRLVQRINGKAAEQFGIEVSGLLRQDLAGKGDVADLFDPRRIHQKRRVGALAHAGDGFRGISFVYQVLLIADGFFGNFQDPLQHDFVQLDDVEFALPGGNCCR